MVRNNCYFHQQFLVGVNAVNNNHPGCYARIEDKTGCLRTLPALFLVGIVATEAAQVRPVAVPPEVKSSLTSRLETWRKLQTDPKCLALGDPQKDLPGVLFPVKGSLRLAIIMLSQIVGVTADGARAALYRFGLQKNQADDQGHNLICMSAARGSSMTKALSKVGVWD